MTCEHVLDVIDAGPFVDVAPATLAAARDHARGCATCGPALDAAEALTIDLAALAHPAPPPQLAFVVLARISRIDAGLENAAIDPALTRSRQHPMRLPVWSAAAAGFAVGLAMVLATLARAVTTTGTASLGARAAGASVRSMLAATTDLLPLAVVLLVFVAGLFATVPGRSSLTNSSCGE